jgi:hypothetical protein
MGRESRNRINRPNLLSLGGGKAHRKNYCVKRNNFFSGRRGVREAQFIEGSRGEIYSEVFAT